jgi:hypothetical protein
LGVSEAIRLAASASSERSARSADESLWALRERPGARQRGGEIRGVLVDEPSGRAVWVGRPSTDRVDREAAVGGDLAIPAIGGVLGIAVLAAVFSARGGYATPSAFVEGFVPALTIGAITVAIVAPRLC